MSTPTKRTVTLGEAAELLGIGRTTAYSAARAGTFPTPVVQIGSRWVVPTKPLLELLGMEELPTDDEPVSAA